MPRGRFCARKKCWNLNVHIVAAHRGRIFATFSFDVHYLIHCFEIKDCLALGSACMIFKYVSQTSPLIKSPSNINLFLFFHVKSFNVLRWWFGSGLTINDDNFNHWASWSLGLVYIFIVQKSLSFPSLMVTSFILLYQLGSPCFTLNGHPSGLIMQSVPGDWADAKL